MVARPYDSIDFVCKCGLICSHGYFIVTIQSARVERVASLLGPQAELHRLAGSGPTKNGDYAAAIRERPDGSV